MTEYQMELLRRVFAMNEHIVKQNYQITMVLTQPTISKSKEWKEITQEEVEIGLLASDYSFVSAGAWRDGVKWAEVRIKEKNS